MNVFNTAFSQFYLIYFFKQDGGNVKQESALKMKIRITVSLVRESHDIMEYRFGTSYNIYNLNAPAYSFLWNDLKYKTNLKT